MKLKLLKLIESVREGESDALKAYVELKNFEKLFKEVISECNKLAVEEAEKYGAKNFKAFGAEITLKNNAGRWDFKGIKEWELSKASLKEIEDKFKLAYKAMEKGLGTHEEGVVTELPKYTSGATNVTIK